MDATIGLESMNRQTPEPGSAYASKTDAELVLAARQGDKRAFVEIVVRHQAMVCGITLSILGDFAASEDAGQEAFLTVWRKFSELREPERLRSWLAQIARNAALGQLRRRRGHQPLDDALALADEAPAPDEAAAGEEESALVRQSLLKLPETHRVALILYYREGQSVKAVAEALEISEDAVKQRLARGREMLRERMSGVVESALSKSRPNAVFTMTIAAAIGALAAPSVMAGTIFASTSTATASTAAASTPSLVTFMSTSKAFLIATAVVAVLCVPIGYRMKTVATAPPPATPEASVAVVEPVATTNAPLFSDSALFAEWRALHDQYGTNAAAMPALHKAIGGMKDAFRRHAFRAALIAEWVQVDPAGGFQFMLGKDGDSVQRRQFFEEWLARDPHAATAALLAAPKGWEKLARDSLSEIARRDPGSVTQIASKLPASDSYWDHSVRDAFAILAQSDMATARRAAESMTGASREQALSGVARAWAETDLNGAVAWAKSLPEGTDRDEVVRAALLGAARKDPAAALDLVNAVPPGGRPAFFASSTGARVLVEASDANFDATVAWLATHPGKMGRQDLVGLAGAVTERLNADTAGFLTAQTSSDTLTSLLPAIDSALLNGSGGQRQAIWDWLKSQPDNETTRLLRDQVLRSAGYQDPSLALQLVADLPASPDNWERFKNLANSLFNGGSALSRYDQLLAQAPENMRQPLIDAALQVLNGNNLDDTQRWISRIAQLPETSRAAGSETLARAWAEQSPEAAVAWAATLSPASTRATADAAIAQAWGGADAYAAAQWVGSLPTGPDRDGSVLSLVNAVASKYPRESWDWALSIGDDKQRTQAAQRAVMALGAKDATMARQLIEASAFETATKTLLLASIPQKQRAAVR